MSLIKVYFSGFLGRFGRWYSGLTEYAAAHCFVCPFGYRMKLFLIEENGRGVNSPNRCPAILTERYSLNPAWMEQVADATRQAVKCQ